jgi:hypothetical protein
LKLKVLKTFSQNQVLKRLKKKQSLKAKLRQARLRNLLAKLEKESILRPDFLKPWHPKSIKTLAIPAMA